MGVLQFFINECGWLWPALIPSFMPAFRLALMQAFKLVLRPASGLAFRPPDFRLSSDASLYQPSSQAQAGRSFGLSARENAAFPHRK